MARIGRATSALEVQAAPACTDHPSKVAGVSEFPERCVHRGAPQDRPALRRLGAPLAEQGVGMRGHPVGQIGDLGEPRPGGQGASSRGYKEGDHARQRRTASRSRTRRDVDTGGLPGRCSRDASDSFDRPPAAVRARQPEVGSRPTATAVPATPGSRHVRTSPQADWLADAYESDDAAGASFRRASGCGRLG